MKTYFITGSITGKHVGVSMIANYPLGNVIQISNPLNILDEVAKWLENHELPNFAILSITLLSITEINNPQTDNEI